MSHFFATVSHVASQDIRKLLEQSVFDLLVKPVDEDSLESGKLADGLDRAIEVDPLRPLGLEIVGDVLQAHPSDDITVHLVFRMGAQLEDRAPQPPA
jgi:hypothetical protein